jgi:hypothetical protein
MNKLDKQYSESIKEAYKKYEDNWLKENPPFAGPYTNPCLTIEQFSRQQPDKLNLKMRAQKLKVRKIIKEYKAATTKEIWEGVRDNFTFGFIGATLVVFIATRTDIAVLLGYLLYYNFMGTIVNRPKYVTDLGKLIVFPFPSALGAFAGYKLSYLLLHLI